MPECLSAAAEAATVRRQERLGRVLSRAVMTAPSVIRSAAMPGRSGSRFPCRPRRRSGMDSYFSRPEAARRRFSNRRSPRTARPSGCWHAAAPGRWRGSRSPTGWVRCCPSDDLRTGVAKHQVCVVLGGINAADLQHGPFLPGDCLVYPRGDCRTAADTIERDHARQ